MNIKVKNKGLLIFLITVLTIIDEAFVFGVIYLTSWLLSLVLEPVYPLWLMSLASYLGFLVYRRIRTNYRMVEEKVTRQTLKESNKKDR